MLTMHRSGSPNSVGGKEEGKGRGKGEGKGKGGSKGEGKGKGKGKGRGECIGWDHKCGKSGSNPILHTVVRCDVVQYDVQCTADDHHNPVLCNVGDAEGSPVKVQHESGQLTEIWYSIVKYNSLVYGVTIQCRINYDDSKRQQTFSLDRAYAILLCTALHYIVSTGRMRYYSAPHYTT